MKIIIAGSRTYTNFEQLCKVCDDVIRELRPESVEIVSGTAAGADKMGEIYAAQRGYPVKQFPADWKTHGRKAGYLRNELMARYADTLIAFWDGESRGTNHMITLAKELCNNVSITYF